MNRTDITRREALKVLGGAVGALALGAGCQPVPSPSAPATQNAAGKPKEQQMPSASTAMPAVFLPHGGGPWPFIDHSAFGAAGMWQHMDRYMRGLSMLPPKKPDALLVVSAHWEAAVPSLMTARRPPMFYDYYGFPPEAYEVQWPAPGAPEIAERVRDVLESAGFRTGVDEARGFDHGTFVPLKLAYPDAEIPTTQLSLKHGLDPAEHFAIGQALAPLRDEGVFIIGSGMSYHNMRAFMMHMRGGAPQMAAESKAFDDWLVEVAAMAPSQRQQALIEWEHAPAARASHPREEHLLPLMVIAGAAAEGAATVPYRDQVMGAHISALHFS